MSFDSFSAVLAKRGLELTRGQTVTLQINMGLLCNQFCRHCHLEAGPDSKAVMDGATVDQVIAFAQRGGFETADLTGGAPEMNPHLQGMIESLSGFVPRLILRSNLTAIADPEREDLLELCRERRVVLIASLPATHPSQTEAQRGKGVWEKSLATLRRMNALGYGQPGSPLELHLVSNPSGAFLPTRQSEAEAKFRRDLGKKYGIVFHNLYTFANVPLGRFRRWLVESGNLDAYTAKLAASFNPCTLEGVMCRTLVSVSWDGSLYDCDFNLAAALPLKGRKIHVSTMEGPPPPGTPIVVSDHCYACTAGLGFT